MTKTTVEIDRLEASEVSGPGEDIRDRDDSSSFFPFKSRYLRVLDSTIHYIDEGTGDPILFLHGIPTSCYLWRNIIPKLTSVAHCLAPDLIGMGKSGKPDIAYRIFDHINYIEAFIDALELSNITLVLHGWGSVIGFDYAMRHPSKVKAIAFFESHVRPSVDWDSLSLPMQIRAFWLSDEKKQYKNVVDDHYFINHFLPKGVLHRLSSTELDYYKAPFANKKHRKVLWQYFCDLPLGDGPRDVIDLISRYTERLQASDIPKLILYAVPGFITTIDTVVWCRQHLKNLTLVDLGEALHFAQESSPDAFSDALLEWYQDFRGHKEK